MRLSMREFLGCGVFGRVVLLSRLGHFEEV